MIAVALQIGMWFHEELGNDADERSLLDSRPIRVNRGVLFIFQVDSRDSNAGGAQYARRTAVISILNSVLDQKGYGSCSAIARSFSAKVYSCSAFQSQIKPPIMI